MLCSSLNKSWILVLYLAMVQATAFGQQPDSLSKKLDSLEKKADSSGEQKNIIRQEAYTERTKINFPVYFILLGSDFKQQATKLFHMTKKDWKNLGIFTLSAAGLALLDEPVQHFVVDLRVHNPKLLKISNYITNTGGKYEAVSLTALFAYGMIFKNEKIRTTALLASQSYITSAAFQVTIKALAGRQRPFRYHPDQVEAEPRFHGPIHDVFVDASGTQIGSSFPSGHTTAAFAAATVFAMEYKDRPLVAVISYSFASMIGLSRITENKHWLTDVFTGAALGYITGMQVVNNYHRYATIKNQKKKKGSVSFILNPNLFGMQPGVRYTFN
jgi:membrane-associated phospholipid phosphatase